MERDILVGKIYRHVTGSYYRVICIANDSTLNIDGAPRQLVVYESLGNNRKIWVRPYDLFNTKTSDPDEVQEYRFELVDDSFDFGVDWFGNKSRKKI